MQKSESIKNLAEALVNFQAEVKNPSNTADNPFFKSKYAPLPDILNDIRPIMAKQGLAIIQSPSGDGDKIIVTTMLVHKSGEWMEFDPLILKADKATAQGAGSAITYGRRYALSAVLGISSEDDDDGNHASDGSKKKADSKQNTTTKPQPTTGNTPKKPAAAGKPQSDPPRNNGSSAGEGSDLKWDNFWKSVGGMGFDDLYVHDFARTAFNKPNLQGLKEVITTQKQLNEFLSQLAKKKAGAA